jgi:hypothetical protein
MGLYIMLLLSRTLDLTEATFPSLSCLNRPWVVLNWGLSVELSIVLLNRAWMWIVDVRTCL